MASIIKRNNNFCVVYSYKDANGIQKQKWETFTDLSDAKNRKKEVEYKESVGTFVVPQCKTLNDLLPEYPPKESNRDRLCGIIDSILAEKPTDYEDFLQKLEQQG